MLFNTPEYFVFLIIVLLLYYSLTRRFQNYMLLVASYIFYGFWDYRFLSLMFASTIVDYAAARLLENTRSSGRRQFLLLISIALNLSFLGFFKYFNFFIDNAERVLAMLGFQVATPVLYVILPAGISFYTFESMSYVIDVYRGKTKATNNFADFALFIAYFPKLVAGPIMRISDLLPALQGERKVTVQYFSTGLVLILIGLFRKVVIADGLGAQIDPIFAAPANYTSPELMKAIYLFALQIYCDFAGYSDIARGTSRLLGIELMENFNHPYFAANISEFWRRWHISLSTWLRDYLYIPLGGNRHGAFNTNRNLMLTMLLGGLWHGAAWTFVVWGGLHGLYLIGHRWLSTLGKTATYSSSPAAWGWRRWASIFITFHLVVLAWVFFRASGLRAALDFLSHLVSLDGMHTWSSVWPAIAVPWLLILAIDIPQFLAADHTVMLRWPNFARNVAIATILLLILLGIGVRAPFIYFQF
jgi:D-alanyl-lipoteichoic acid acyltransferase DltB (MBOAT superfamily)